MKINRSVKCYFNKWLTKKKAQELKEVLIEYSRVCNYFVKTYENEVSNEPKFYFLSKEKIHKCIKDMDTFLTFRLVNQAFCEAYSAIQSSKSKSKNREDGKYFSPKFYGKKMTLSEISNRHGVSLKTILFDFNLTLKSLRTDRGRGYKISIPLKKHKQFNKWNNIGILSKSITITDKYVMFNFKIETGSKKEVGDLVGVDFGIKKLCALSNNTIVGKDIENHLRELQRKKRCSKSYYRKKEEIKEYINKEIKNINFEDKQLIVVEDLKNIKYKMKERGRLSKNIRSVFYNLSYRQVLSRIQTLFARKSSSFSSRESSILSIIFLASPNMFAPLVKNFF